MAAPPHRLSRFWLELKRRKVIPILIGYLTACIAIIELSSNASDTFSISKETVKLLYLLSAAGIPLVIILPWHINKKKTGLRGEESDTEEIYTKPSIPKLQEKSIIVLPFENISPDPDQEYFSDGLTEEIITDLSYIDDLLVISRSSAMTFKGTKKTLKEVTNEVGVRYVLEGSVRKAGKNIRIVAQLIDGANDSHIWAEKYNGTLEDIFDIQEKVSFSIADALKIKFSEETQQKITTHSFKDPDVYEIYLQARNENWKFTESALNKGEELLKKGIKMAGDNDLLYTELCHVNVQYVNNLLKDPGTYSDLLLKANQYALKAVQTNPSSAQAYYARGMAMLQSCHPRETIENWNKAIEIDPNHPEPMLFLLQGFMYSVTGLDLKEAEALMRKAGEMDPLNLLTKTGQGWRLIYEGRFQEALDEFADWQLQLEQFNSTFLLFFVWQNGLNKDFKEAFRIADKISNDHPKHIASNLAQFIKHAWLKEKEIALKYLTKEVEQAAWWDDAYSLMMAECYSLLEEYDEAFKWLDRAIDYGVTNIPFLKEYNHFLDNLRSHNQFNSSLKRAGELLKSFASN